MLLRKSPATVAAVAFSACSTIRSTPTFSSNVCTQLTAARSHTTAAGSVPPQRSAAPCTVCAAAVTPTTFGVAGGVLASSCASVSVQRRRASTVSAPPENDSVSPQGPVGVKGHRNEDVDKNHLHSEGTKEAIKTSLMSYDTLPPAVYQRINSNKRELLRLLRYATSEGTTAIPAVRFEAALRTHLDFHTLATQHRLQTASATSATSSSSASADTRSRPSVPDAWMEAVWEALALHCIFYKTTTHPDGANAASSIQNNNTHASLIDKPKEKSRAEERKSTQDLLIIPFDWAAATEQLAAHIPYEGWTESEVYMHLRLHHELIEFHTPLWLPRYTQADSLAGFLHNRFAPLLLVTRSAVTQEALVHRVGRNSVSVTWRSDGDGKVTMATASSSISPSSAVRRASTSCVNLQHALHTLGRGHQLPVWTDAVELAPLLTSQSPLSSASPAAWMEAWLRDADLRACFHLDGYVRLRAAAATRKILLVVDLTTLGADKASFASHSTESVLRLVKAEVHDGAEVSVKLLTRPSTSSRDLQDIQSVVTAVLKSGDGSAASAAAPVIVVESVVVDLLLEPWHMLGPLLDAEVNSNNKNPFSARGKKSDGTTTSSESERSTQIFVLCGAGSRAAFGEALKDVRSTGLEVTLLTPLSGEERVADG